MPTKNLLPPKQKVSLNTYAKPSSAPQVSGGYTPAQSGTRPAAAVAMAAPRPAASSGGGGGGSSDNVGGGGSEERYWWQPDWQDSAYNSRLAAVNRALADFETELGLQGQRYGTDYLKGVKQLGFRPTSEFQPTVDIFSLPGIGATGASGETALSTLRAAIAPNIEKTVSAAPTTGVWDYEGEFDPFSAAARGTRTSRDEFAGRGTLRSSDFAKNYADFQNRMQEQLNAMETGRTRYFEDAAIDLAKQRATAEEQRQAARIDAMARAASAGEYRTR